MKKILLLSALCLMLILSSCAKEKVNKNGKVATGLPPANSVEKQVPTKFDVPWAMYGGVRTGVSRDQFFAKMREQVPSMGPLSPVKAYGFNCEVLYGPGDTDGPSAGDGASIRGCFSSDNRLVSVLATDYVCEDGVVGSMFEQADQAITKVYGEKSSDSTKYDRYWSIDGNKITLSYDEAKNITGKNCFGIYEDFQSEEFLRDKKD